MTGGLIQIVAYGTEALGVMRVEKGHPAGNELNGQTTAQMLGMEKMISKLNDCIGNTMSERIDFNIDDGLKIQRTYITNILKCVPPGDKPLNIELNNCANYFDNEISILKDLKVIVTLGKVAFDNCIKFYKRNYSFNKKIIFKHGVKFDLPDGKILIPSYHPSPRNVNTKIINLKMMTNLFINVKKII